MSEETKRTILCVDDEPEIVSLLHDAFMEIYNVKTATSAEEALKIFNEEDISLVITDQRMPGMEGTELLAKIDEIKPICKKILLTGYADIKAAINAINLSSVDKYFSKPWEDEELAKAVKDLIVELTMDEFFEKAIKDAKGMKEEVNNIRKYSEQLERFLGSYLNGVCVVGNDDKIKYLNERGLVLIKCKEISEIKGKDFKDIFSINESNKKRFLEKYMKKDLSSDRLDVKLCDGTSASMQANVTFASDDNGIKVSGIVFKNISV